MSSLNAFLFEYQYISKEGRAHLHKYHYEGVDASVFSKLLQPFWEGVANRIPRNIAPNLITMVGFIGVLIALALTCWYFPTHMTDYEQNVPSWLYIVISILFFYYQTVDAVDGKHARNTNMQTALGELFDHGLDAIQITIQAYIMCCTMQLGATVWTYIVVIALYITGYILIWEDYCTNELRFGEYNSPTEAMVIVLVMLLSVACFGNSFWINTAYTGELVGIDWLALNHLFVYAGLLLAVSATVPTVMYVVQKAKEAKNDRLKRIGGVNGSLSSLFPSFFVVINYCGYLWVSEELYSVYPKTYLVALGCVSWYIQTRLILSRVANEKIPSFYTILVPLPLIVLHAIFIRTYMEYVLFAWCAFVLFCYIHLIYNSMKIMSNELNISFFKAFKKKTK